MKRKTLVLYVLIASVLHALFIFSAQPKVSAEACHNTSSFGSVTVTIPELSNKNDRLIWVRMKASEANKKVLLQINNENCLETKAQDTASWNWVTYSPDGYSQTISFPEKSGNSIKIIGVDSGVKVDRLLVTDSGCKPVGFGTNCEGSVAETTDNTDQAIAIQSVTPNPVSGKATLSNTPAGHGDLKQLTYSSSGKILQKSAVAEPFNSILLPNGRHTVYITTTLSDGTEVREYTEVDIENSENPFTPAYRWFLLNKSSVGIVVICIVAVSALVFSSGAFVNYAKKRRERTFRGL